MLSEIVPFSMRVRMYIIPCECSRLHVHASYSKHMYHTPRKYNTTRQTYAIHSCIILLTPIISAMDHACAPHDMHITGFYQKDPLNLFVPEHARSIVDFLYIRCVFGDEKVNFVRIEILLKGHTQKPKDPPFKCQKFPWRGVFLAKAWDVPHPI